MLPHQFLEQQIRQEIPMLTTWLDYISSVHPQDIELGLERTRTVAQRLGVDKKPTSSFLYTVTGTNGKGSCCALLASACTALGLSYCVYTSPHLLRFNERLACNGSEFADQAWVDAFARVEQARGATQLTYFEYTTLAAFELISRKAPAVIILEVGLGGRLDAVNIWDCDCALLSSLGIDHQQYLGNTLADIFREKIAIQRPDKPVVVACSELPTEAQQQLNSLPAPSYQIGRDYHLRGAQLQAHNGACLHLPELLLQAINAATCWQALQFLPVPELPVAAIASAWSHCQLPGRQQRIDYQGKNLIIDVAHNPQAALSLVSSFEPGVRTACIIAMLADKDCRTFVEQLSPYVSSWHCFELNDIARALPAVKLAQIIQQQSGQKPSQHPDLHNALRTCQQLPEPNILITGSFYAAAAALSAIV